MIRWALFVLLAVIGAESSAPSDSILEGRIYEDAPPFTPVTLHPEFELTLGQFRGCLLRVLRSDGTDEKTKRSPTSDDQAQRTIDSQYFQYDTFKLTLHTVLKMDRGVGEYYEVPVAAFCAGDSESVQWMIIVRVSQMNRYSPSFDQREYPLRISKKTQPDTVIGSVHAQDMDVVIYNSVVWYKLVNDEAKMSPSSFVRVDMKTGAIRLASSLTEIPDGSVSVPFEVEACDYGSPRKCDIGTVKIEMVTVESPANVTVVTAEETYQILCWSQPRMAIQPEYYTLYIDAIYGNGSDQTVESVAKQIRPQMTNSSRLCTVIDTRDLYANRSISAKVPAEYHIKIGTHAVDDEATSQSVLAIPSQGALTCNGTCFHNGVPACQNLVNDATNSTSTMTRQFEHDGQPYCLCPKRFDGNLCQNERFCESANFQSDFGHINWNRTPVDSMVKTGCPYGPDTNIVSRKCVWNVTRDSAVWTAISGLEQCHTVEEYLIATSISGINLKSTETRAKQVLNTLSMLEGSSDAIIKDKRLADRMIDFINATIGMDLRRLPEREEMGSKIRSILMSYAERIPLAPGESSVLRSDNVVASVTKVSPQGIAPIPINVGKEATLNIPSCVVQQAAAASVSEPRISAIWLRDDKIFSYADKTKNLFEPGHRAVIIIIVEGLTRGQTLLEPISFSLMSPNGPATRRRSTHGATCVFWHEKQSKWSNDGVQTVLVDPASGSVQCQTSHLTGFSILLDFEPGRKVDESHRRTLNMLSWIGCVCSIVTLIFTIITYSLFPCLHRDHAGKVLLNLCTSMLFLNIVFILSSIRPMAAYSFGPCVCIGAFLHYFTLSTLLWMGVEAANMYQMLVQVFATTERLFMVKRCAVAWGIPLVVVLGTLCANMNHYYDRDDDYCRLSSRYPAIQYGVYLAPACLILLINCIGFAFVLKVLTQTNAQTSIAKPKAPTGSVKYSTLVAQVRGALSVMVLLGITWVLGAFAVGPVRLPFMYAFCVLNSLQGFIIFLVRCLCYDEARRAWCMFLRTGKLKQHRGKSAIDNRFSDSRSSSNPRFRRANTASTDIGRPLTTFQNGQNVKRMSSMEEEKADPETEISLIPRCWKFIDEPSSTGGI